MTDEDKSAAAELLRLATNVWRGNAALQQNSWASLIGHVRLDGAHAGVDAGGRLVLVVPHRCQEHLLPVLERELQQLADKLKISLVAITAARPVPALPGREGGTLDELLEDLADATPELLEQRTRAHGSFTLEIPVHDCLQAYAELAAELDRGTWAIADAIDKAKETGR